MTERAAPAELGAAAAAKATAAADPDPTAWRHEEVRNGHPWCGYPVDLVDRTEGDLVVALRRGAPIDFHTEDHPWRALGDRWRDPTRLVWYPLDERAHSVAAVRGENGALREWYVNIQAPVTLVGTAIVTRDLELDVVISADLASYRVKDLDKFNAACAAGSIGPAEAATALTELDRVVGLLRSGDPWWDPERWNDLGWQS